MRFRRRGYVLIEELGEDFTIVGISEHKAIGETLMAIGTVAPHYSGLPGPQDHFAVGLKINCEK
jgi:hypothetical protein